jgi:hypothetical protein
MAGVGDVAGADTDIAAAMDIEAATDIVVQPAMVGERTAEHADMPAGLAVTPVEHVAMPVAEHVASQVVVMPVDSVAVATLVDSVAVDMPVVLAAAATAGAVTDKLGDRRD